MTALSAYLSEGAAPDLFVFDPPATRLAGNRLVAHI